MLCLKHQDKGLKTTIKKNQVGEIGEIDKGALTYYHPLRQHSAVINTKTQINLPVIT